MKGKGRIRRESWLGEVDERRIVVRGEGDKINKALTAFLAQSSKVRAIGAPACFQA